MLQALKDKAWWVLAYASDKLHSNKEFMLEAVKANGQLLYYASSELRDDKDVVMEAVKNKWLIVKYASKRLRGDKDIALTVLKLALTVLKQSPKSQIYLTDEIKQDSEVDAIINPKIEEG